MLRPWLLVEELCRCVLAAARKSSSRMLSTELETSIDVGHIWQLRKVLAGSRYQIVNYRSLGYELIVADASASLGGSQVGDARRPAAEAGADRKGVP